MNSLAGLPVLCVDGYMCWVFLRHECYGADTVTVAV